jgi:hypothetical protein
MRDREPVGLPRRPTGTTRRLISLVSILAIAGGLVTACGDDETTTIAGESPDTTEAPGTTAPGDTSTTGGTDTTGGAAGSEASTVYSVLVGGGFVPLEVALAEAPSPVILSDGTVYRPGAVPAIFPGPALPALETTTLEPGELDEVLALVDAQRALFEGTDFGEPPIADVPTTTVLASIDGELSEAAAFALGFEETGLTPEQTAARQELSTLIADVQAIVDEPDREWQFTEPTAMLARSYPPAEQADVDPGPPVEFPVDDAGALSTAATGFGCMELTGEDLDLVLETAADATQITPWIVGDETVQIVFRPVYPHETGCQ